MAARSRSAAVRALGTATQQEEEFAPASGIEQPSQSSQIETLIAEVTNLKQAELAVRASHRDLALRYNRAVARIEALKSEVAELRAARAPTE